MSKNNGVPSIKKKFVGLIRNLSQPGCTSDQSNETSHLKARPNTFIHKYLQGEGRCAQPTIIYGRSVEELPPRPIGRLGCNSFAAFTGPGGGLAAVNRTQPVLETSEPDVDFIDAEDALPDDQPNAYVTCQIPPPRKNPFGDIAEYFRSPKEPLPPLQKAACNGTASPFNDNHSSGEGEDSSDDSLECEFTSWRGEAPSPLSPHPSNTPSNAFLRFGNDPLVYGLGVSSATIKGEDFPRTESLATRSCENLFCPPSPPIHTPRNSCGGGSLGSLEGIGDDELDCPTPKNEPLTPVDMNLNPIFDSPSSMPSSEPLTPRTLANLNDLGDVQSAPATPRNLLLLQGHTQNGTLQGGGHLSVSLHHHHIGIEESWSPALSNQEAKFLAFEFVEGNNALTGPDPDLKRSETEEIAGLLNWNRPHERAYGLSTTLYERHPITHERAGNPIADAFGVIARENSAVLALADGVNWGEEASLAAKCAIHGCLSHINTALFSPGVAAPVSTTDLFVALLRSFHSAHNLILQEHGMLTTLTVAVVTPLLNSESFVVCVCNVGDSLAYVYSQTHGVREITQGSHDIYSMRDMRDALGALGPVDGLNPELNNLTCSMTFCEEGDIVFLTSDGISDNFDPVVGKFVLPRPEPKETKGSGNKNNNNNNNQGHGHNKNKKTPGGHHSSPDRTRQHRGAPVSNSARQQRQNGQQHGRHQQSNLTDGFRQPVSRSKSQPAVSETELYRHDPFLPIVEAHQRHELALLRMEDLLRCGLTSSGPVVSAQALCLEMVHFATKLTVAKRRILEDPDLYPPAGAPQDLSRNDQRNRRRKVCEKLALVPGKLDHATVVAYTVGSFFVAENNDSGELENEVPVLNSTPKEAHRNDKFLDPFRAPLASPDSTRSIVSQFEDARYAYIRGDPIVGDYVTPCTRDSKKNPAPTKSNGDNLNVKGGSTYKNLEKENTNPNSTMIETII